jgi:hypothetical protein
MSQDEGTMYHPAQDTCPSCGALQATRTEEEVTEMAHPEMGLAYTYTFPAYTCSCGFSWTGSEREVAQTEARLRAIEHKCVELWRENKLLRAFKDSVAARN